MFLYQKLIMERCRRNQAALRKCVEINNVCYSLQTNGYGQKD